MSPSEDANVRNQPLFASPVRWWKIGGFWVSLALGIVILRGALSLPGALAIERIKFAYVFFFVAFLLELIFSTSVLVSRRLWSQWVNPLVRPHPCAENAAGAFCEYSSHDRHCRGRLYHFHAMTKPPRSEEHTSELQSQS